jgi:hypothetical protein
MQADPFADMVDVFLTGTNAGLCCCSPICRAFASDLPQNFFASSCSFALLVFFLCCLVLKVGTLSELPNVQHVLSNEQERDFRVPSFALTAIMATCVFGAVSVAFLLALAQIAQERKRKQRELAKNHLPTCDWKLTHGQSYVCFLSHYKIEAGAACRYLKDALDCMLGCPVYLEYPAIARTLD